MINKFLILVMGLKGIMRENHAGMSSINPVINTEALLKAY